MDKGFPFIFRLQFFYWAKFLLAYDDDDVVFVYINNSLEPKNIPWTYYKEIAEGLTGGVNVITGEPCEVSDATVVEPQSVLIVEYTR